MSLYALKIPKYHRQYRKDTFLPENIQQHKNCHKIFCFQNKETLRCPYFTASFTVEAAVIFPLAASFFVSILFFFFMLQTQLCVQKALNDTGRKLAVYSREEEAALDIAAAQALFLKELSKQEFSGEYILGGRLGISLLGSEFDEQEVRIRADYSMRLPIQIFWTRIFVIEQHADCRKWNGYSPAGEENGKEQWVYITKTGNVYHCTKSCTHLELSIRSVLYTQIPQLRSENGEKYHMCSQCVTDMSTANGIVYITNQGNRYHSDLNCSGIKRTIYMVRLSDTEGRRACSRCCAN